MINHDALHCIADCWITSFLTLRMRSRCVTVKSVVYRRFGRVVVSL